MSENQSRKRLYWQKTAVCELGCGWYHKDADGTEACRRVGYILHPDWCEVLPECDEFQTEAEVQAIYDRMGQKQDKRRNKRR